MAFIRFHNITLKYQEFEVMNNFNFEILTGEIITFFGPSGCGKTTLMKAVLGMLEPAKGTVEIENEDAINYNQIISYTPQDNQLLPWLSIFENIQLWAKQVNVKSDQILEILETLELTKHKDKLPQELSGGMARRTSLARGMITKASIICLDEVLVSVERKMRHKLMMNLRSYIKKNKMTAILISHDYEEAIYMSDRIVVLSPSPTEILKIIDNNKLLSTDRNKDSFSAPQFLEIGKMLINP